MFYAQKKTHRPGYNKPKFPENERWDNNVDNSVPSDKNQPPYYDNAPPKYRKQKRYNTAEGGNPADLPNQKPFDYKKNYNNSKRWAHVVFPLSLRS